MITATILMALGLMAGIALVQYTGLRMGGVVVIPLLAIYTLHSATTLPLFIASVIVAVYAVGFLKSNTLLHGRPMFLASLGVGMIVPLVGMVVLGMSSMSTGSLFLGTILPGVAAYNYHQLDPPERVRDVAAGGGVLLGLIVAGMILIASPTQMVVGSEGILGMIVSNVVTPISGEPATAGAVQCEVGAPTDTFINPDAALGGGDVFDSDAFDEWLAATLAAAIGGECPDGAE